ncbi:MAG TPA: hypothetical protein VIL44_08125 [Micromonospora sp.]
MTQPSEGPVVVPLTSTSLPLPLDTRQATAALTPASLAPREVTSTESVSTTVSQRSSTGRISARGATRPRRPASTTRKRPADPQQSKCRPGQWPCPAQTPRSPSGQRPRDTGGWWRTEPRDTSCRRPSATPPARHGQPSSHRHATPIPIRKRVDKPVTPRIEPRRVTVIRVGQPAAPASKTVAAAKTVAVVKK